MKKYIAPMIFGFIALILILTGGYFYFLIFRDLPDSGPIRIIIALFTIGVSGAMIVVMIQRIKEIREEDKYDLSKY